ncbi:MAG: ATP-binding protein [Firmicutes bacterium]|nr:ATP-binding protein [Bacillota bacterium]
MNENMKEILELKNFGGIKNVTVEFNKINIFIGEQATGKSLIAKVLFFCKNFFNYYKEAILQHKSIEDFEVLLIERFKSFFDVNSLEQNFSIQYKSSSLKTIKIYIEHNEVKIIYDQFWKNKFDTYKSELNIGFNKLNTNCDYILKDIPIKKQIFIPAARAVIAMFQNQMWKIIRYGLTLDPFLIDWGNFYEEEIKNKIVFAGNNLFSKSIDKNKNEIMTEIIKGEHKRTGGVEYLKQNNRNTPLAYLSSGQQEAISLVELSLLSHSDTANDTVYIEEPEAHLYPKTQKIITEMIARVFNEFGGNMQIVITTHSPYILTSLNNLMYAGTVEEKILNSIKKKKELYEIVDKKSIIKPEYVNAYFMQEGKNGNTIKSIIDEETKLINAEEIDDVSFDLADKFDKLSELEFDRS